MRSWPAWSPTPCARIRTCSRCARRSVSKSAHPLANPNASLRWSCDGEVRNRERVRSLYSRPYFAVASLPAAGAADDGGAAVAGDELVAEAIGGVYLGKVPASACLTNTPKSGVGV